MFTRSVVYRVPDHAAMPTPLSRSLTQGFNAMRDTEGLTVDDDAGYDVLAVAVVRWLGSVPGDTTADDLLAALSHRAISVDPTEVA